MPITILKLGGNRLVSMLPGKEKPPRREDATIG